MLQKPVISLLLLIIMISHEVESWGWIELITQIIQYAPQIISIGYTVKNWITGSSKEDYSTRFFLPPMDMDANVPAELNFPDHSMRFHEVIMRMEAQLEVISEEIEFNIKKCNLVDSIWRVYDIYNTTIRYSRDVSKLDSALKRELVEILTGKSVGNLYDTLQDIKDNIAPSTAKNSHGGILDVIHQHTQNPNWCGKVSASGYLYNLYETIVVIEYMSETAEMFGHDLQRKFTNANVNTAMKIAEEQRQERLKDYVTQFAYYFGRASTSIRSCDPRSLIRDETFFEMENLYNAVVRENHHKVHEESDRGECSQYDQRDKRDRYGRFSCRRLYQCRDIAVAAYCLNMHPGPRRYQWIEDHSGKIYGKKEEKCNNINLSKKSDLPTSCVCTCEGNLEDKSPGVQFFRMAMARSDHRNNKVVTGVRLSRPQKGIAIDIEIKQGTLLSGGRIKEGSEEWLKSKETCSWDLNKGIPTSPNCVAISSDNNFIDLDDLIAPENHVVTGVGFDKHSPSNDGKSRIRLKLEYMELDLSSGVLKGIRQYLSSDSHRNKANMDGARSPLQEETPRYPTTPYTQPNSYIQFGMSDFETDAGQTTLPLLDATNVEMEYSVPLSGIGLFYKNSPKYGGFLAFRIHTLVYNENQEVLDTINDVLGGHQHGEIISTRMSVDDNC